MEEEKFRHSISNRDRVMHVSKKRRSLIRTSIAFPAAMLLPSVRIWAQTKGHGPADELPMISVTAPRETNLPVPSVGGPVGGYSWTAGFDNIRGGIYQIGKFNLVNGRKILSAAEAGRPLDVLSEFAYGMELASNNLVKAQIATYGLFTQWLANNGWQSIVGADQYGLSNTQPSGLTTAFGLFSDYYFSHLPTPPISEFQFYATPFFTLAAYDYWIRGNGSPRAVDLKSLRLGIGANEIGPIRSIIVNDGMGPGAYPIDAEFSTNLLSDKEYIVGSALGRVSGHVVGQLVLTADGGFSFSGECTLNPDKFDFDASNSRPYIQEMLTTLVRKMGEITGHTDFMIYFKGSQPLNISGSRRNIKAMDERGIVHRPSMGGLPHLGMRDIINGNVSGL